MSDLRAEIAMLASADAAERETAAKRLYTRGELMGVSAASGWLQQPELASLLLGLKEDRPHGLTVGVAVLPETFKMIRSAWGEPRLADVPPDQDALEFALHLPGDAHLDILTTKEPGGAGAIARFLKKFSEGIQQVELLTTDVDRATRLLRDTFGLAPVYPGICAGADGRRVNFFLVPTPDGRKVLIELVEAGR